VVGIANLNLDRFAGAQVSDRGREDIRPLLVQQEAAVTLREGVVEVLERALALFDSTADQLARREHGEAAHRRAFIEWEDIDGLDRQGFPVAITLSHGHIDVRRCEARVDTHTLERNGLLPSH